jgi:heptosyltransferase I
LKTMRSGAWSRFQQELREDEYDLVLDAQGLVKSGIVARQARGPIAGRNAKSAREATAALFYKHSYSVDLQLTEIEQLRQLFALALNYERPKAPADFGIETERLPGSATPGTHVALLHGAGWKTKLWPEENWISLAKEFRKRGLKPVMPWGSSEEYQRAGRIAAASGAEVLPKLTIGEMAPLLRNARFAVGLDTGLTHVAIALKVKTVTLYGPSVPVYDAVQGGELVNLSSTQSRKVDTRRPNTVALARVLETVLPWCP